MQSRRDFLNRLCALALPGIAPMHARAAARLRESVVPIRFTKLVRDATKALSIPAKRWKMVVGHHSAVKQGNAAIYDRAHRMRGMENGLAYHFLIGNGVDSGDGQIEIGPRWLRQIKGGHVRQDEVNEVAIGICLVGNFEIAKPTENQLAAFQELMTYLRSEVTGRDVRFMVHREVDPGRTLCPGRNFPIKAMHRLYG
jgi:N-acetylmuramoyl-L-alanine amidase